MILALDISSFQSAEVVASSIAAIAALLTLWFTSLRGPDIELLSKKSASYTEDDFHSYRMLSSINLRELELVFTNNGSRTGLIAGVNVELQPEAWFAKYYRGVKAEILASSQGQLNYPQAATSQTVSISRGSNKIVQLSCAISTTEWKVHPNELDPSLPLGQAIRKGLDSNRGLFEEFVKALNDEHPIGKLSVTVTLTARKWGYKSVLRDRRIADYDLPPLSPKLKENFQKSLALWDDIYPEYQRVVSDAVSEVRRIASPIKSRLEYLKTPIQDKDIAPLPTMEVDVWLQEVDRSYPQFHAIRKGLMMWYKELGEALPQYRKAVAEFNIEVDRFNLRKTIGPVDTGPVQKAADQVRPIVERTIAALGQIEAELANIS